MKHYRLVVSTYLVLLPGEDPEDFEFDPSRPRDRVAFDRHFIFGKRGAVRKLQKIYKKLMDPDSWSHEYRLYEILPDGTESLVSVPDIRGRSYSYSVFGIASKSVDWHPKSTTTVLWD